MTVYIDSLRKGISAVPFTIVAGATEDKIIEIYANDLIDSGMFKHRKHTFMFEVSRALQQVTDFFLTQNIGKLKLLAGIKRTWHHIGNL